MTFSSQKFAESESHVTQVSSGNREYTVILLVKGEAFLNAQYLPEAKWPQSNHFSFYIPSLTKMASIPVV